MDRISPPPKDLNSFLGRKWLESLARQSVATALSVANSDGSLTISPTTGAVIASLNLNQANTWTADQSVPEEAYGAGWDGSAEVPTKNAIYDKIESLSSSISGTYTPTRSAETNLDSNVTMTEAQYMQVGDVVTVSGRFTADPTLAATVTSFEIDLPVASNIGAVEDLAGTAFCGAIAGMGAEILGVVANNTAKIQWISSDIASQSWSYSFTYQVI